MVNGVLLVWEDVLITLVEMVTVVVVEKLVMKDKVSVVDRDLAVVIGDV